MKALENILSKITYHKYQKELSTQCILKAEFIAEKLTSGEYKEVEENLVFMFKQSLELDNFDQMLLDLAKEVKKDADLDRHAYFFIRHSSVSEIQLIAYDKKNRLTHIATINEWCFCDIEEVIKTFTEISLNIFNSLSYLLHKTHLIPPEEIEEGRFGIPYNSVVSNFIEKGAHQITFGLRVIRMTQDNKIVVLTDEDDNEEIRKRNIILTDSFRSMESKLKKKADSTSPAYYAASESFFKREVCYDHL